MQTVTFLVDYRGQLTNEQYFTAGMVAPFPFAVAEALVAGGRAEYHESESGPVDNPPFLAEALDALPEPEPEPWYDWTQVKGVSTEIRRALNYMGLTSPSALLAFVTMTGGDLTDVPGIGKARAAAIVEWAEDNL